MLGESKLGVVKKLSIILIGIFLIAMISAEWDEGLNDGLVLYYNFSDAGTDIPDGNVTDLVTGKFNQTTATGNPLANSSGIIGGAMQTGGGTNDTYGTWSMGYFADDEITICMWVNIRGFNDARDFLFQFHDTGGTRYEFWAYRDTTKLQLQGGFGANYIYIQSTDAVSTNSWNHFCFRGNFNTPILTASLNGTNMTNSASGDNGAPSISSMSTVMLPILNDLGHDNGLNALVDELAIWNRSLTDAEITQLYNEGAGITYTIGGGEESGSPPYFTAIANQSVHERETWTYDINANDDVGVDSFWINDLENFTINSATGVITNNSNLEIRHYTVNVSVNDTSNNINTSLWGLDVTAYPYPEITLNAPTNKSTYTSSNVSFNYTPTDLTGFNKAELQFYQSTILKNISLSSYGANITIPISDGCTFSVGNFIYFYGGITPTYSKKLYRYNITGDNWDIMTDGFIAVEDCDAVSDGTEMGYVVGGKTASTSGFQGSIQIYNTSSDTWSMGQYMEQNRSEPTAVYYNNKVYVFGGSYASGQASGNVSYYDIATNSWNNSLNDISYGARFFGSNAIEINDIFYLAPYVDNQPVNHYNISTYDPLTDTFTIGWGVYGITSVEGFNSLASYPDLIYLFKNDADGLENIVICNVTEQKCEIDLNADTQRYNDDGESISVGDTIYSIGGGAGGGCCGTSSNRLYTSETINVWIVNETNQSAITNGTINTIYYNLTSEGNYTWRINLTDSDENQVLSEARQFNYSISEASPDTTPPYFTTIPADDSVTYPQEWTGVDFEATDETAFDSYVSNDSRFTINSSGYLDNVDSLAVGIYQINITINDSSNNINSTIFTFTINQNSSLTLGISGTSPITYGTTTDVAGSNCPSELSCSLDKANAVYGAGTETFNYSTAGNENYTTASITTDITINKADSSLGMNISGSGTITYPQISDFSSSENNTGDAGCSYSMDLTNAVYGVGTTTFNYSTSGCANYTQGSITKDLTVNQNSTYTLGLTATTPITYGTTTDFTGSACPTELSCSLNISNAVYGAGKVSANYSTVGNENYTSNSATFEVTINQVNLTASLSSSNGWNINYSQGTTISVSESNSGDDDVNYSVYRDGTLVGVGAVNLSAGTYEYFLNTTGGANYTANSSMDNQTLTINQLSSSINLTINDVQSNRSIVSNNSVTLNCSLLTGDTGTLSLYNNGTLINSGTSPIGNTTTFTEVALYNITCVYAGSTNYTTISETWWLNSTEPDSTAPILSILYPLATSYSTTVTTLKFSATDNVETDRCWYSTDGGSTNSSTNNCASNFTGLSAVVGSNTWTLFANDTSGNLNSTSVTFTRTEDVGGGGGGSSTTTTILLNNLTLDYGTWLRNQTNTIYAYTKDLNETLVDVDDIEFDIKESIIYDLDFDRIGTGRYRAKFLLDEDVETITVVVTASDDGKVIKEEELITLEEGTILDKVSLNTMNFFARSGDLFDKPYFAVFGGIVLFVLLIAIIVYVYDKRRK